MRKFGEKAFTAKGFNARRNIITRFFVVDGQSYDWCLCPPCYDADHYGWAASISCYEISNVKFYEAGSNLSKWLTPPPPRSSRPRKMFFTAGGYRSLRLFHLQRIHILTGEILGSNYVPRFREFTRLESFIKPDYENNDQQIPDNRTTILLESWNKNRFNRKGKGSFYNSDLKVKPNQDFRCKLLFKRCLFDYFTLSVPLISSYSPLMSLNSIS